MDVEWMEFQQGVDEFGNIIFFVIPILPYTQIDRDTAIEIFETYVYLADAQGNILGQALPEDLTRNRVTTEDLEYAVTRRSLETELRDAGVNPNVFALPEGRRLLGQAVQLSMTGQKLELDKILYNFEQAVTSAQERLAPPKPGLRTQDLTGVEQRDILNRQAVERHKKELAATQPMREAEKLRRLREEALPEWRPPTEEGFPTYEEWLKTHPEPQPMSLGLYPGDLGEGAPQPSPGGAERWAAMAQEISESAPPDTRYQQWLTLKKEAEQASIRKRMRGFPERVVRL